LSAKRRGRDCKGGKTLHPFEEAAEVPGAGINVKGEERKKRDMCGRNHEGYYGNSEGIKRERKWRVSHLKRCTESEKSCMTTQMVS